VVRARDGGDKGQHEVWWRGRQAKGATKRGPGAQSRPHAVKHVIGEGWGDIFLRYEERIEYIGLLDR
jgi:hypothetical protein